jgi:hypothetical protein
MTFRSAMEFKTMRRTVPLISLGLMLLGTAAIAQPYPPPPLPPSDQASRDMYCRHSAAASTGYTTPGQAANRAQTNGTVGGLLGGAALGAIIGGRNAGTGAAIGAGVGALAGTAVGSANADRAASDVQRRYSDTYYACMNGAYGPPPPPDYYAPPPPPPGDYPPPPPGAYGPPPGDYPPPPPPDGPYPR